MPAASSVYVLYYLRSWNTERTDLDLCIEGLAVGFGARPHADGIDAVYYVAQKNYPIEFAEMEFGVRVEGYAIHTDSGGPGLHRGGCGIVRDLRVIGDEAVIGVRMDNIRWPAWGVKGGMGGGAGRIVVNPGTPDERELRPMSEGNRLKKGDLVRIMTSGGGGWGSPLERAAEQVRDDVLDGFISAESAARDYGVVLTDDLIDVDAAATDARAEGTRAHAARPVPPPRLFRRRRIAAGGRMSGDLRIGVDIGGTFTDVVVRRPGAPSRIMKIPTTRSDPSIAVLEALKRMQAEWGLAPQDVRASCTAPRSRPTPCWSARARRSASSPPRASATCWRSGARCATRCTSSRSIPRRRPFSRPAACGARCRSGSARPARC